MTKQYAAAVKASYSTGANPPRRHDEADIDELRIAAHDLAQPICSLRVYLSALRRCIQVNAKDAAKAADLCESLEKCAAAIQWTIESLVHRSANKPVAGSVYGSEDAVSVHDVLLAVRAVLQPLAQSEGVEYREAGREGGVVLPPRFARAIVHMAINLGVNAIKYKSCRGNVASVVLIGVAITNRLVRLYVIDNGRGICEADLQSVFELGWRGGGTTEVPGFGIGMFSVTQCLDQLPEHQFSVRSKLNGGTRFVLRVPLASGEALDQ